MTNTGRRSHTDRARRPANAGRSLRGPAVLALSLAVLAWPAPSQALDLFTLWDASARGPVVADGDWAIYRMSAFEAGRRTDDVLRIRCLDAGGDAWRLEVAPVAEDRDGLHVLDDGVWTFTLARDGDADLRDRVSDVVRRDGGRDRPIPDREWREDPLLSLALSGGFTPDDREPLDPTTRWVDGVTLMCDGLALSSRDTTTLDLPRGRLLQIHVRTVTVALHDTVPFLGVVHAVERAETRSEVDPPGRRRQPPPQVKAETMELISFGRTPIGSGG